MSAVVYTEVQFVLFVPRGKTQGEPETNCDSYSNWDEN